jgi:hypothetical protein
MDDGILRNVTTHKLFLRPRIFYQRVCEARDTDITGKNVTTLYFELAKSAALKMMLLTKNEPSSWVCGRHYTVGLIRRHGPRHFQSDTLLTTAYEHGSPSSIF